MIIEEAKFFASIGRQRGSEAKTEHVAYLVLDLCRLCLLVREQRTKVRDNGRYLVLVFNRPPGQYLPFSTRSSQQESRDWLRMLLSPGIQQIEIDLKSETKTFHRVIGQDFIDSVSELKLALKVVTSAFAPIQEMEKDLYWGYLIRVVDFQITSGKDVLKYVDTSTEFWKEEQDLLQKRIARRFLRQSG
ncbi:MAG: hypothetical protein NT028_14025 [candidate division Zixibacteria bacterium]|nr:hypothetical protein [candidate division Zixibacteria bacterium]